MPTELFKSAESYPKVLKYHYIKQSIGSRKIE